MFADKRTTAPNGVTRVLLSEHDPGMVKITLQAAGGAYPLVPVDVALVLGDDTDAAAGLCGRRAFSVTECGFDSKGQSLRCRH